MTAVRNFRQTCLSRVVYPHRHTFRVGQLTQWCVKEYNCVVFGPVTNSILRMDQLQKTALRTALDDARLGAVQVALFDPFGLPEGRDDPMLTFKLM
jgi:hypothetical protein